MQNFLEKLNTPAALISVLAVIILANGALFYQSRSSSGDPSESGSIQSPGNFPQDEATMLSEQTTAPEESISEEPTSQEVAEETTVEEPSGDGGASGEGDSGDDRTPVEAEDSTLLAGLGSSVESCQGSADDEECIRSFVLEVAPDSRYVGGRVDLATGGGQNTEVIYFEDPRLTACEFERAEYRADGGRYAVILVGEGSFNDERGAQCIPQA